MAAHSQIEREGGGDITDQALSINEISTLQLKAGLVHILIHKDFPKVQELTYSTTHPHQSPPLPSTPEWNSLFGGCLFCAICFPFPINQRYRRWENLLSPDPASLVNHIRHASCSLAAIDSTLPYQTRGEVNIVINLPNGYLHSIICGCL